MHIIETKRSPQIIRLDELAPHWEIRHAREHSIIRMLGWGWDDRRIARSLNVAPRTVQRDLASLLDRFEVRSRFSAGAAFALNGWITSTKAPD